MGGVPEKKSSTLTNPLDAAPQRDSSTDLKERSVLISLKCALELKLLATVRRRQLWVVTLSQEYPAHFVANQSI
jgi:hypothetical protein